MCRFVFVLDFISFVYIKNCIWLCVNVKVHTCSMTSPKKNVEKLFFVALICYHLTNFENRQKCLCVHKNVFAKMFWNYLKAIINSLTNNLLQFYWMRCSKWNDYLFWGALELILILYIIKRYNLNILVS